MNKILLLIILSFCVTLIYSQDSIESENNLCLNLRMDYRYESFLIGLDNPLDIVYAQDEEITLKDITATFEHYETKHKRKLDIYEHGGHFSIRPDSLGRVTISVETKDGVKQKVVHTKTLMAVGKLSRYKANHSGKISRGEFRAQMGIIAAVEGYDIYARCATLAFDIIRISSDDKVSRAANTGARFIGEARALVSQAESGDVFVFRNIMYKCPGDDHEKRLDDMIFEIE